MVPRPRPVRVRPVSAGILLHRTRHGALQVLLVHPGGPFWTRRNLGAWATTIGAPTRYMHSTVQLCHLDDVEATVRLLAHFPSHAAGILPADWR